MEPITATVLISLLFSEAVKEGGKALEANKRQAQKYKS